jgi:hypothetical protein
MRYGTAVPVQSRLDSVAAGGRGEERRRDRAAEEEHLPLGRGDGCGRRGRLVREAEIHLAAESAYASYGAPIFLVASAYERAATACA